MDWPTIASLAAAFGVGTILSKTVEAVTSWRAGRHKQAQDGWAAADRANRRAQVNAEVLYETRMYCHVRHGTAFRDFPPLPGHLDQHREE